MEPPVSSAPWSPDFLAQTLELLIVYRASGGIQVLRPIHADALRVGWSPGRSADATLLPTLGRYGLTARILHSTSWRHDGDHVVLTYLAVVEPPDEPNQNLVDAPVARVDLARGDATGAPASIAVAQVLEHALRHLAWLLTDDAAIAAALPDWQKPLAAYVPEPFRGL
jgi:hypothetical protein